MTYKNKTGFLRVTKIHDPTYKKGYSFFYRTKNYQKWNVDIFRLKNIIQSDGYKWEIVNLKNAIKTIREEYKK